MSGHDHDFLSTKGPGEPARDPLAGLRVAFGEVKAEADRGNDREVVVQTTDTMLGRWVECRCAGLWPDPRPGREGQYILCFSDVPVDDPPKIVFQAPERPDDPDTEKFNEATGDFST